MTEMDRRQGCHSIQMEDRRKLTITGVLDVSCFHEREIILKVQSGVLVIGGEDLHVGKLVLDDGKLDIQGQIDSLVYEKHKAAGSLRQLFRKKA